MRTFAVFAVIIYGTLVLYIETQLGFNYIYYLWVPYYSMLTILYILVIIVLNCKMRNLKGGFNMEIESINKQFLVFLFAYITRLAFEVHQISTDDKFDNFYACIFISVI